MPQAAPLVFIRNGQGWIGEGAVRRFDLPVREGLEQARRRLAQARREGESFVAFCALPFDADATGGATILVPERVVAVRDGRRVDDGRLPGGSAGPADVAPAPGATVEDGAMSRAAYREGVAEIAAAIGRGELQKAVLARDVRIRPAGAEDPGALVDRLLLAHPDTSVFSVDGLVGASPETLVTVHGGLVTSRVLAGTAAPGDGARLLASAKDQREHELAARSVVDALAPHLTSLRIDGPKPIEYPRIVHLATDVTGAISDASDVLALVAALHPTAAVAGVPTATALDLIHRIEPTDRGRYAGPVGWFDGSGDGEFAIALRSAQALPDGGFRAFAGAGVMADSDPAAELAETDLKLGPILEALGVAR